MRCSLRYAVQSIDSFQDVTAVAVAVLVCVGVWKAIRDQGFFPQGSQEAAGIHVNYFGPSGVGGALETVPAFDGLCLLQGFWVGVGAEAPFIFTGYDQPPSSQGSNLEADFLLILAPPHLKQGFTLHSKSGFHLVLLIWDHLIAELITL